MGLKELFKNTSNKVISGIKTRNENMQTFNLLKTKSTHLQGMQAYEVKNSNPQTGIEQRILNLCLNISVVDARLVNKLISLNEVVVAVRMVQEAVTMIKYVMVLTDNGIYFINKNEYKIMKYEEVSKLEIITSSLVSGYVNFNENAFIFEGTSKEINFFCNIVKDKTFRDNEIIKAKNYLCGIVPALQYYNQYFAGITLSKNGDIVIHNGLNFNKAEKLSNLDKVELILDTNVVMVKAAGTNPLFGNFGYDAHKMTMKFIFKTETILIDILPTSLTNRVYKKEEEIFNNNFEFAKSIMNKIAELKKW